MAALPPRPSRDLYEIALRMGAQRDPRMEVPEIPASPRREDYADDEQFRAAHREWSQMAQETMLLEEQANAEFLQQWREDHPDIVELAAESRRLARHFAEKGLSIISLVGIHDDGRCGCDRPNCTAPGKHGRKGYQQQATSDPDAAEEKFSEPVGAPDDYAVPTPGAVMSPEEGCIELDFDDHDGAGNERSVLEAHLGRLPETLTIGTPRNGEHLIFIDPRVGNPELHFRAGAFAQGCDLITNGQSTPLPPTRGKHGRYTLLNDAPIAELPQEWIDFLARPLPQVRTRTDRSGVVLPEGGTARQRRYVAKALENEAKQLARATSNRNGALNNAAFQLGKLMGALEEIGLDEMLPVETVEEELLAASEANGYVAKDGMANAVSTLHSGLNAGRAVPRDLPESFFEETQTAGEDRQWPLRTKDDFGLGDRLYDHFGDQLRWIESAGKWVMYEAGRWRMGTATSGRTYAREMITRLPDTEALQLSDEVPLDDNGDEAGPSPRGIFLSWVSSQRTAGKIEATAKVAAVMPQMQVELEEFDTDPMLLNVANGVVDLQTGELMSHDPEQLLMHQAPVNYDPDADCPMWLKFLEDTQPDEELRSYVQRLIGYSITGQIGEQAAVLHHGSGANGKSVLLEVIGNLLGDYSQVVPASTLMAKKGDGVPNDVARMKGARFLQTSETASGRHMDEQVLKSLTGGEKITARFMRGEWFDFKPTGKIHLATNHLPGLSGAESVWRRLHLVPWSVVIPPENRIGNLAGQIVEREAAGVLAWAIRGCLLWQEHGLDAPQQSRAALAEYREDQDTLGQFIVDRLDEDADAQTSNAMLYMSYQSWAQQGGHQPLSQRRLTQELKERGFVAYRTNNERGFRGLSVKHPIALAR